MKKLLLSILIFVSLLLAQNKPLEMKTFALPQFFIDAINTKSEQLGKTKLDLYVQIPYSSLQFIKSQEQYKSRYSVNILIYDKNSTNILESVSWENEVLVKDYVLSTSNKSYSLEFKSILLKPDNYNIKAVVEDLESKKTFIQDIPLIVTSFDSPLNLSDIIMIEKELDNKLYLNLSRIFTNNEKSIRFYYDTFSDSTGMAFITYSISDVNNQIVYRKINIQDLKIGKNTIYAVLDSVKLSLGNYKINVEVKLNEIKVGRAKSFVSKIFGYPSSIKDVDLAVRQMRYIAQQSEMDYIIEAENYDEKVKRFIEFWKMKDPDPSTDLNEVLLEYYRRVDYANITFKGYSDGWRSDMGMIYITLGQPDNIERHPFDSGSRPYEVWTYNHINSQFLFVDFSGFGEYRLQNTNYRDWSRYRY